MGKANNRGRVADDDAPAVRRTTRAAAASGEPEAAQPAANKFRKFSFGFGSSKASAGCANDETFECICVALR